MNAVVPDVLYLRNLHPVMEDTFFLKLQTVPVFLADTETVTACRSVSIFVSLNRKDSFTNVDTYSVILWPGELLVTPENH